MSGIEDVSEEMGFESLAWSSQFDDSSACTTPAITPGPLSTANRVDESGIPIMSSLTAGVHWTRFSYPAWVGTQRPREAKKSEFMPSESCSEAKKCFAEVSKSEISASARFMAPFSVDHIAATIDEIRVLLGFQFHTALNAFELFMSQLDSRSSRSCPKVALKSLYSDYIGGRQSNFRKWYFAAEMDSLGSTRCKDKDSRSKQGPLDEEYEEEMTLTTAEAIWDFRFGVVTDQQRLEEIIIYLLCWTEANQIRFMPECLAFIVNCAREYYYWRHDADRSSIPADMEDSTAEPSEHFFIDCVITPLYNCYCSHNFVQSENGVWLRREGDHKDFIGYDDMNQLFWYRKGLEKINASVSDGTVVSLLSLPQGHWYILLQYVQWQDVFIKTYRESRSWLHVVTNFSRIWIPHAAIFWFYTSFNSPTIYTVAYNYLNPAPPREFVRWTIMSLGGLIGPVVTFAALIGELRFIPRVYPGAKPVLPRLLSAMVMFLTLAVPAVCALTFNDWSASSDFDFVAVTVLSGVLFAMAVVYTLYFTYQPLDQIFGGLGTGRTRREDDKIKRRYLANQYFTADFPKLTFNDWVLSWFMCLAIFSAKMLESYFFLTLSLRDPIRELDIMTLEDTCLGDKFLIGTLLCRHYPKIILITTIFTDMILFFLDTYLWYVIFNTIISACVAIPGGTSIWTPWRNIYSRLSHRISSKLIASSESAAPGTSSAYALRIIWAAIVEGLYEGSLINREQAKKLTQTDAATQEPSFFTMNEDGSTFTTSEAAYRRISFFAQSLSTPMQPVTAVTEMPSFTLLIPHYKEKIILSLRETINNSCNSKVTTLDYLRRLYPVEWENFVLREQLSRIDATSRSSTPRGGNQFENVRHECLSRVGFSTWDPNDTNPTRLWASERSQTLYRTVRGFYNYSHAIKVIFHAERQLNRPENLAVNADLTHEVAGLINRKFRLIIAIQLYEEFDAEELQNVNALFNEFPGIMVSFVMHDATSGAYYSCLIDSNCPVLETGKRRPKMKIKLSGNPILGDGKSDNQNSALVFYRGEYIQLIDANQDNYLEECLKIRNVLMEFEKESPITLGSNPQAGFRDSETGIPTLYTNGDIDEVSPIAIVGAREYIFSENIGVLGDVAAGKEQTFGTLFARTLARTGAKLHYGHPDILNAIFMTTRGGVSKGQRGLHLNEDIYAGMTAILRGGRIRHSDYFQCGKGRDLGFVSILNFTAKIGAGMGEQLLSREYFYMGTQLPFDRFISFYYAHPGFHLNNVFIMLSIELLLILTVWFSSLASVSTLCSYNRGIPSTESHLPAGCKNVLPLLDWIRRCVVSIFLVFFVSLCPLYFQEVNEKGFYQSAKRILKHFCSLSMLFEIFVCRVYARSFLEDLNIGGAKYVATGRGLATARISFYKLYSGYHSEIMTGIKAVGMLTFASMCLWHVSYIWFWVTATSLCVCPFLYNPQQFAFVDFFLDYQRLLIWFFEAVTPDDKEDEGATWSAMVRSKRNKITGVKRRTRPLESSRPSFRDNLLSEVGGSMATVIVMGIPYVYMNTQKTSRHENSPKTSAILRLGFITVFPLVANFVIVLMGFFISVLSFSVSFRKSGNYIAALSRTLYVCVLLATWWILYVLERQRLSSTLLGIMVSAGSQYAIETIFTVFILQRQRNAQRTNDPWWTGNWGEARLGWKCPLIICEEMVVKTSESLRFSYDFLTCHLILAVQVPLLLIPFVVKIHCLFLLWLPPSICSGSDSCGGFHLLQARRKRAQLLCVVFFAVLSVLVALMALPPCLPEPIIDKIAEFVDNIIPWDSIK